MKTDFKKQLQNFYQPSPKEITAIDIPEMSFLSIDGENAEPENSGFQQAIEALFSVSFKAKFIARQTLKKDYVVMPLEGLWWADDMDDFKRMNKTKWKWQLMIMQPSFVTSDIIDEAAEIQFKAKKNPAIKQCQHISFQEGKCMQLLHIGPYADEGPNIQKIHQAITESGGSFDGQEQKHHEIYLSDFRKTDPKKLKTIIRQPYRTEPISVS